MLWLKEVNKSFKQYLTELFKGHDIPVKVINALTYASDEEIPCITIFAYDNGDNLKMTDLNSLNIIKKDTVATLLQKETKRDITVQLDFYTDKPSLMDELTFKWVCAKKKFDTFDITDSEGNIFVCKCIQRETKRLDVITKEEVLYRTACTMSLTIPIQQGEPQTVGIVEITNPIINTNKDKEE